MAGTDFHPGADLPWGWWLLNDGVYVIDADGRRWDSVRDAFWEGRLGMRSGSLAIEQQERLMRVLASVDAPFCGSIEHRDDLFDGDDAFWCFYMTWLGSTGLLDLGDLPNGLKAPLSEEGRAVLAMLRATRRPTWADLPMAAVVEAVARADRDPADDAREAALRTFERSITAIPHLFAREDVGRVHLVTLTSLDATERLPVRRRIWSVSFLDERRSDDLFGWLAQRVHRWADWSDIAHRNGAGAFSAHLLGLLVAHPVGAAVDSADGSGGQSDGGRPVSSSEA